jgi:hypothetical protein
MTTPTKADILKAAAIERMLHEAKWPEGMLPTRWFDMKNEAFLRMETLERIARDMDDE